MESQRVVEHLAHELRRSVVIADMDNQIRGVSYRAEDHQILSRDDVDGATAVVQDWLRAPGTQRRRAGETLQADSGPAWVTIPLLVDGDVTGWAVIAWRPAELRSEQLALVDIAATLFATVGSLQPTGREGRRVVFRNLLDSDPATRRASLRRASTQRWLDRRDATDMHALIFDDEVDVLERLRITQVLSRTLPGRAEVLRERDDAVFVLSGRAPVGTDIGAQIRAWAAKGSVPLRAVGSAAVRPDDEDLARAAHAAVTVAELSLSMPELANVTTGDSLGGWALLHAVKGHRGLLSVASPAAELLCTLGDTQRETVEVYLDEAGQARAACERLHIHRTTLYYRLDNLPEVVKAALADGMQRSTLHLALKLDRLWAAAGV
ncbi:helix-turn-helix domain-containing protein [Microbacterium sp. 1P10UB]|uniref:PucR family transcriptional regulator n=1 Tax=unclassified Microbacterium TaxID=2609290 RepID=UPI0039A00CD2